MIVQFDAHAAARLAVEWGVNDDLLPRHVRKLAVMEREERGV
jgi:hypothetical protein